MVSLHPGNKFVDSVDAQLKQGGRAPLSEAAKKSISEAYMLFEEIQKKYENKKATDAEFLAAIGIMDSILADWSFDTSTYVKFSFWADAWAVAKPYASLAVDIALKKAMAGATGGLSELL